MDYNSRRRKLIEIAYMYYIDGLSQSQIAEKISLSRSMVSIMLNEAKLKGIVQIRIKNSDLYCFDLERKLEKSFRLKRAIVIPELSKDILHQKIEVQLADAVLNYLNQIVKDNMTIGFSWGPINYQIAKRSTQIINKTLLIIPLAGGISWNTSDYHPNIICKILGDKCESNSLSLYVPNFLQSKKVRDEFYNIKAINEVIKKGENTDIAIVGIHNIKSNIFSKFQLLNREVINNLKNKGAIGEINTRFYDKDGYFVDKNLAERSIAVDKKYLRKTSYSIGVGGGINNSQAIHGALKSRIFNVIVTDEGCAREILALYSG